MHGMAARSISALHIWWARKPLPSCRAAALAASFIETFDLACPEAFKTSVCDVLGQLYGTKVNGDGCGVGFCVLSRTSPPGSMRLT